MNKQDILDLIKRTAEENNGNPLGQGRFKNVTGIGPYQIGRYWPRYSDAVKEAGFSPNDRWTRTPDEVLAEQMILLIREFGRYPTLGEMRIYQTQNPDFRYTIIKKRKQQYIVNAILDYCKDKPECGDILELCEGISQGPPDEDAASDGKSVRGFVYLVKGHPGEYKIGSTDSINRRIPELDATSSVRYQLVHEIETDDRYGIESYWHKRFEAKRMRREWFRLKAGDVAAFRRWKKIF